MKTLLLKLLFFVVCALSTSTALQCQPPPSAFGNITIASPNAAALGKYGDYPVSYNTGLPQINIPIYTITEGSLSLPIGLSYHASGLKVMEAASSVGAGWSLNAGGVITRTVVGAPDDRGYLTNTSKGHFSDYGYNSYLFEPGPGYHIGDCYDYPEYNTALVDDYSFTKGIKDGEPDLFFFNFNSYSGKFYFRDDRTPILVPEDDFKIEPILNSSSLFTGFTITTPDGVKYYFGKNQLSDGNIDAIESTDSHTGESGGSLGIINSSWYLNRIVSPDNQFSINLIYAQDQYSYYTISLFPVVDGDLEEKHCTLVKNFVNGVKLTQINFSNGSVAFSPGQIRSDLGEYQNTSMADIVNTSSKSVGNITISNNANFCKQFNFYYSYFQDNTSPLPGLLGSPAITTDTKRLKLDSLQELSCDNNVKIPPYKFDYNSSSPGGTFAPRRLTFAQDHWGFYNGKTSNTKLIPTYTVTNISPSNNINYFHVYERADRESSWPEMSYGTISKITYPTGGSTKFVFEANSVWGSYTYYNEIVKTNPSLAIGTGISTTSPQSLTMNFNTTNTYKFTLQYSGTGSGRANVSGPLTGLNVDQTSPNNKISYNETYVHYQTAGSYTYTLTEDFMSGSDIAELKIYEEVPTTVLANKLVGGLRIDSIITLSSPITNPISTAYNYLSAGQSTGVLYSRPTYVRILRNDIQKVPGIAIGTGYTGSVNGCVYADAGLGFKLSPSSLRPMETVQGNHIGYNRIEVSQTGNGKSVYNYFGSNVWDQNQNDVCTRVVNLYSCDANLPNYPDAPLPYDSIRGQLSYESHFDQAGNLLKSISYTPIYASSTNITTPAYKVQAWDNGGIGVITLYSLSTCRKTQMITQTNAFSTSGNTLTTVDTLFYESPFHHQVTKEVTIDSKGIRLEKRIKYAFDYRVAACDAISDCYQNYNSSYTSALNTYQYALGHCTNTGGCNCKWPAFQSYRYNWSVARKNFISCRNSNFNNPTNAFKTAHDNAKSGTNSDIYLKPILEMQDRYMNNVIETSSWKDGNLLNAIYNQYGLDVSNNVYISKTQKISLSQPSSNFTNSTVNGSTIATDSKYSDEDLFSFDKGNLVESTPKSGGLKTAYLWGYNNQYPVAKAVGSTYSTVKGFISQTILDNPSSDAALQTELNKIRTGLANAGTKALVTTYTYAPLIGMTSQSDVNNRLTSYEYDGLGRLSLVRDQNGYIRKKYQYAYQSANPDGGAACDGTNCTGVDEKCVNGFCEKASRHNSSTQYMATGTYAGKWKCNYEYYWSDGSMSNPPPEYNLLPCDVDP